MNARVLCGTSGFSYESWKPDFYPAGLPSRKFLSFYSTKLNAVESNYTFRNTPSTNTLENWIAETPADFLFAVKGHQSITHFENRPLKESCRRFFGSLEPLREANRLGPVLFQFPPTAKANIARLRLLLDLCPPTIRVSFEFRHDSWFEDRTFRVLTEHKSALCLADSERLQTPKILTAGFAYYRLRRTTYSDKVLREVAQSASALRSEGNDTFIFFMHQEDPTGPAYAVDVLKHLKQQRPVQPQVRKAN